MNSPPARHSCEDRGGTLRREWRTAHAGTTRLPGTVIRGRPDMKAPGKLRPAAGSQRNAEQAQDPVYRSPKDLIHNYEECRESEHHILLQGAQYAVFTLHSTGSGPPCQATGASRKLVAPGAQPWTGGASAVRLTPRSPGPSSPPACSRRLTPGSPDRPRSPSASGPG